MLKKTLALLCCLLLLPLGALAETAPMYTYRLTFDMDASAYPADLQGTMTGMADLLNALSVAGTFTHNDTHFDLHTNFAIDEQERTRTAMRVFGSRRLWSVTSPLLGDEILTIDMIALLEFAIKGYSYLEVPFQRAAILTSPYVHQSGLDALTSTATPVLFAEEGSRNIPFDDLVALADRLEDKLGEDRAFYYWAQAMATESGYDDQIMSLTYQLRDWVEENIPVSGIDVTVDESGEIWTAGPLTLVQRETDLSGAQSLSVTLPPFPDGTLITLSAASQPDGDLMHFSVDLEVTNEWEEDALLTLHTDGSLPTVLPVARPFSLTWDADGLAVGGDGVHLFFQGEAEGDTITLRQLTPDHSAVMLTVTAEVTVQDTEFEPQSKMGTNLLSVNATTLAELMDRIASPLARGVIPLIAQAPASFCQSAMDMLEDSGVFSLLTAGFDSGDDWYDEGDDW